MDINLNEPVLEKKKYTLQKETEIRFEVPEGEFVKLTLTSGFAECFGAEVAKGKEYTFTNCSSCIFTWQGCTLDVEGDCKAYIGEQTPMVLYANAHCILQKIRQDTLTSINEKKLKGDPDANKIVGPKVMVVGSTDSGKSSFCKLLCNYASRMGELPLFVDLDIGQGLITVPGMMGAIPVERPIDPEDGLGVSQPIVQFFGDVTPSKNPKFYVEQIKSLSKACHTRFEKNSEGAASGMIINTCGWVDGDGYKLLLDVIDSFTPTIIFILGHEKLYSSLSTDIKNKEMKLVKLPKSGGVVTRDHIWRRKSRRSKIKEYFYGISHDLCPRQVVLPFQSVSLYRIIAANQAPSSTLPLGMEPTIDNLEAIKIPPTPDMRHLIVGVSYAKKVDELLECNVAGFLYFTEINFEKQVIVALSPCGPIPGEFLILSSIKYIEVD